MYIIPTKRGLGVELWGTRDELDLIYEVLSKFWGEDKFYYSGHESRDKILGGFFYHIRKACEGRMLITKESPITKEKIEYRGCKLSWVHFLFSIHALRYNTRFETVNKLELSLMLQLEYYLEKAMYEYDDVGAAVVSRFISDGISAENENIYLFMRSIDVDYIRNGIGKQGFRKLPYLLKRAVIFTDEFKQHEIFLKKEAERMNCNISQMEINDDDIDYEKLRW